MNPEFFRKYADIVAEAETVQLDEGMLDGLKQKVSDLFTKAKQVPGFAQGYAKAKEMSAQLKQILQTSKSAGEIGEKIKALANGSQVAENDGQVAAGAVAALGGSALMIWEATSGMLELLISNGILGQTLVFAGIPLLAIMLGLLMAVTSKPA